MKAARWPTRVANVVIITLVLVVAAVAGALSGQNTHTFKGGRLPCGSLAVLCTGIYRRVERCPRHMFAVFLPLPGKGINFIFPLPSRVDKLHTNGTGRARRTHTHTQPRTRTRHNLKHTLQGTLIGISGRVDVSYLPLLRQSHG